MRNMKQQVPYDAPADDGADALRAKVAGAVKTHGVRAVALAFGVVPSTLLSFGAGRARAGTDLLMVSRAARLDALLVAAPPARVRRSRPGYPARPAA